jgi:hypothetical protein
MQKSFALMEEYSGHSPVLKRAFHPLTGTFWAGAGSEKGVARRREGRRIEGVAGVCRLKTWRKRRYFKKGFV